MKNSIPFSEFLDGDCQPQGIRADIDLVARIQEQSGRVSDWTKTEGWKDAPQPVRDRLQQAFPAGPHEMVGLMTDGHPAGIKVSIDTDADIRIVGESAALPEFDRTIYIAGRGGRMHLHDLEIDRSRQGQGMGVRILLGTVAAAERLGLEKLTMLACMNGSYVWAKAGFLAVSKADVREFMDEFRNHLKKQDRIDQRLSPVPKEMRKDIKAIIDAEPADPKTIWKLADYEGEVDGRNLARDLMSHICYNAEFRLADAEQRARLKEYAKNRGVKA